MTYRMTLGPRVGAWHVAALEETLRQATAGRGGARFHASKAPVAVFLIRGEEIFAYDPGGRKLDIEPLEALCPGLRDALKRLG